MAERPPNDSVPPAAPRPSPELFQDRYELGEVLGRGGTCTVVRAWDTRLHRYVAMKRLLPPLSEDPHARTRFNREGRAIARLSHPNLVTLIDRGSTESEEYLVFEYVEGRSLKELVKSSGPRPVAEAANIAGQVAQGLAHAHLAGIVHRDVKPQNILLDAEGRAKLTDFGIATGSDWTKVTRVGTIVGSSRYMSPEQVQGRPVDARTDIYSLGIVLYEMLTGRPPFDGTNIAEIGRQHVREKPAPVRDLEPDVPVEVDRVVLRCLEKLPENRFQTMDELLGALVGLDLFGLERSPGGLLDGLLRRTHSQKEGATDPDMWIPPPGSELEAPPGDTGETTGSGAKAARPRRAEVMRDRRTAAQGSRRGILAWSAALLGLIAIAVLAWALLTGGATAPDVVGLALDEANARAEEAGVTLAVSSEQVPSFEDEGIVMDQDPAAGERVSGDLEVIVTRGYIPVAITALDDSDPEGDDSENPDQLDALRDGDPATAWSTESYRSAAFGNIKSGVGVVFDLDGPANAVVVSSAQEGWAGELQARAEDGSYAKVADLTGVPEERIVLDEPLQTGRVWLTSLAEPEPGRFRVQLTGLAFFR
jgi:eukaryotic-like serine/threonine-protein kinase